MQWYWTSLVDGPKLLRGTRDRWVVQVSFIIIYSTGLAPFPRLSAPPHSSQYSNIIYVYQTHQILYKYILCFFSLWWMIKGIWALFSFLFRFLWNRKPWLDNFMFIITLECSKLWIWMGIYFTDIWLIRISRGANNCVQCVFEKKNIYIIMIFPPILNSYYPMKS